MKFLRLTDKNSQPTWVNFAIVAEFGPEGTGTEITFMGGLRGWVQEPPAVIESLLP